MGENMSTEKAKGTATLMINGVEEKLKINHWAIAAIEEEKGFDFFKSLGSDMSFGKVSFLVWAGLLHTHAELDSSTHEGRRIAHKKVCNMLDGIPYPEVVRAVQEAIVNALPDMGLSPKNEVKGEV